MPAFAAEKSAKAHFSFADAAVLRVRQTAELKAQFPARVSCHTPNQILRGDGALVEADGALYEPRMVSADFERDFDC